MTFSRSRIILALSVSIFIGLSAPSVVLASPGHHHRGTAPGAISALSGCIDDNNGRRTCGGAGMALGVGAEVSGRQAKQIPTGPLTTINCGGLNIKVAASAASKFEGFCSAMVSAGYPAKSGQVDGWRGHGSCRSCDMHPRGLAIDYDQVSRDHVTIRISRSEASDIAHRYGLISGGDWCHGDLGHFEVDIGTNAPPCAGRGGSTYSARRHHHLRLAKR